MSGLQVIEKYVYDVLRQRLHLILPSGGVLTLSCAKNPFRAVDQLPERTPDEVVNCLLDVFLVHDRFTY
ncbi:hypothetical protein V1264_011866 [Littorina saxatilis]|uniref:Uncharacterized protein n=1 Tax=Littorina saxatilis TaxID=31220 RepID=A0AAN9BVV8_9CAEN